MYMCFMCYSLALFIFCVLESYGGNFCTGLKTAKRTVPSLLFDHAHTLD